LGQDKNGRIRAMGRGMNITKLSMLQVSQRAVASLQDRVKYLEDLLKKKAS